MQARFEALPQLDGGLFLADGGLETDLIFNHGIDLPEFASFVLLRDEAGLATLRDYYRPFMDLARQHGTGFILESPTWRSSADWGNSLGYTADALADANIRAIELMKELRAEHSAEPIVVSGCIGPRGDGYETASLMSVDEATEFHRTQVEVFRDADADMVTAVTMTNVSEAAGIAKAAAAAAIPSVISFTVETDGSLPEGVPLLDAVAAVDKLTNAAPAYYMINCAHPEHFDGIFDAASEETDRIHGLRANASRMSHAELDESEVLDFGNPAELGAQYAALRERFPAINVLGGCCGTDVRHIRAIAEACA
ncbi:MAG: homocysteine S-methyltransferase family protein [Solirubrobacterales bacterium]